MTAQPSAPTHGQTIEYSDGETMFEGYLALPLNVAGRLPAVLLAHDWSGLKEGARRNADRVAALGYACLAMDVYGKGVRGEESADNTHLMAPLLADRALLLRRLLAGRFAAVARPEVDATRLGAVGYCFGGLCALDLARAGAQGLKAAVSFHGVFAPPNLGPQAPISTSILLLHGWSDPMAKPPQVEAIASELTAAGADWELNAYGHAMHAFTVKSANMPDRGLSYQAAADRRSWAAMRGFLAEAFGV